MNLKAFLKQKQEEWDQQKQDVAEGKVGGYQKLPDAPYLARLTKAEIGESQRSGRPQVAWGWTIMKGEKEGAFVGDYDGLEGDNAFIRVLDKLKTLGVDIKSVSLPDLPDVLDEVVEQGIVAQIRLKTTINKRTKAEFQNLRILKVYAAGEEPDELPADSGTVDDDEVEIVEGLKVNFRKDGELIHGVVVALDEANGTVDVEAADNEVHEGIPAYRLGVDR